MRVLVQSRADLWYPGPVRWGKLTDDETECQEKESKEVENIFKHIPKEETWLSSKSHQGCTDSTALRMLATA